MVSLRQICVPTAVLCLALLLGTHCRPQSEGSREKRQAVQERQFIGGLSTLGALIQPILFMVGVANFMGRIPQLFTRMRDRFSATLSTSGAPAGAGRKKRDINDYVGEDAARILHVLAEAWDKYDKQS